MAALLVRLVAVALLALGPLGVVGAAENSTAATAVPLRAEQSGSLPGGPGGHFAYFAFAYPGGWPMTIELVPHTSDEAILRYAGFNLYGPRPNHVYLEGKVDENKLFVGRRDLNDQDRGLYLLQVYHYHPNPDAVLNYSLRVAGLPPQPDAGEPVPGPEIGASGHFALPFDGVQSGSLPGSTGGAFRYYSFSQPANSTVRLSMQLDPGDAGTLSRAGFKVYGPSPNKEYLQSEADPTKRPNLRGSLWVTEAGVYVVQVYNYNPHTPVEYSLRREP
jgi:hypothetical protein